MSIRLAAFLASLPVITAQPTLASEGRAPERAVGICHPASNHSFDAGNIIEPKGEAQDYLWKYERKKVANTVPQTIAVVQLPKHGVLRPVTEADRGKLFGETADALDPAAGLYAYLPSDGYLGKDKAVFLVEVAGVKVKVIYFFQAVEGAGNVNYHCRKTGYSWRIVSPPANKGSP